MFPFPQITRHVKLNPSNAHYAPRRLAPIQYVILHATAGRDSRAWLTTESDPPVSANCLISKSGIVYSIVPEGDTAFCNGFATLLSFPGVRLNPNNSTYSIELENLNDGKDPYPDVQVYQCAGEVVRLWSVHGLLPVLYHWQVDIRKKDPEGFPRRLFDKFCYDLLLGRKQ